MKRFVRKTASFKDKADCISQALAAAGVTDLKTLENLPARYGARICNEDIYSVVYEIREAMSGGDAPPVTLRQLAMHDGVTEAHISALENAGIKTVDDALRAGPEMADIEGIGKVTANRILAAAQKEA